MSHHGTYTPTPAAGAEIRDRNGDQWTLVLVRELRQPPAQVWDALTDPAQLREWAPFDADRNMASTGPIKLSTFGTPMVSESTITCAEPPKRLEYDWGGGPMRWELEPSGKGTRLTLWTTIHRGYVAWGAAGWHICFDVLDRLLAGDPLGRMAGPELMKFDGWQKLVGAYGSQFGVGDGRSQ